MKINCLLLLLIIVFAFFSYAQTQENTFFVFPETEEEWKTLWEAQEEWFRSRSSFEEWKVRVKRERES